MGFVECNFAVYLFTVSKSIPFRRFPLLNLIRSWFQQGIFVLFTAHFESLRGSLTANLGTIRGAQKWMSSFTFFGPRLQLVTAHWNPRPAHSITIEIGHLENKKKLGPVCLPNNPYLFSFVKYTFTLVHSFNGEVNRVTGSDLRPPNAWRLRHKDTHLGRRISSPSQSRAPHP